MSKTDIIGGDNLGGATRKMTTQDKLSIIVQAMIVGGWNAYFKPRKKSVVASKHPDLCYWQVLIRCEEEYQEWPLAVLLQDPAAMKAIWGEGKACHKCGSLIESHPLNEYGWCGRCQRYSDSNDLPAFTYHQMQAAKLAGEEQDYIKYLYDNLPEGER